MIILGGMIIPMIFRTMCIIGMAVFYRFRVMRLDTKEFVHVSIASKKAFVPNHTREDRAKYQYTQRDQHNHRAFMRVIMGVFVPAWFTVKC